MQSPYLKIPVFFLLSIYAVLAYVLLASSEQTNGFDEICTIYTEAKNSSMSQSPDELSRYIFSNIKNRVNSQDALAGHSSIFNLEPAKRYLIFKKGAESILQHPWNCPAMKALLK